MMTVNDVTRVYDTILSIPGMNETVKIDLKVSRKNILLLSNIIEIGLSAKNGQGPTSLLSIASKDTIQELKEFAIDCLEKAGLKELNEKLCTLGADK